MAYVVFTECLTQPSVTNWKPQNNKNTERCVLIYLNEGARLYVIENRCWRTAVHSGFRSWRIMGSVEDPGRTRADALRAVLSGYLSGKAWCRVLQDLYTNAVWIILLCYVIYSPSFRYAPWFCGPWPDVRREAAASTWLTETDTQRPGSIIAIYTSDDLRSVWLNPRELPLGDDSNVHKYLNIEW